jgi:hypothetical protein
MVRIEQSEYGYKKVTYYEIELIEGERQVFKTAQTGLERAFYIYDTIRHAMVFE